MTNAPVALTPQQLADQAWARKARGLQNRLQGYYGEHVVRAIAAAAGMTVVTTAHDFGIDVFVTSLEGEELRFQVKTDMNLDTSGTEIGYPLDIPSYDYLRKEVTVHRFLVVMAAHPDQTKWVSSTPYGSLMRRSAYFVSLRGEASTNNGTSITVSVPLGNLLTPDAIRKLMEEVG